jgi:hypothetical protein
MSEKDDGMRLKRESLVNIRTVRDIVSSLDRARLQPKIKTTNLLARGGKETQPLINPAALAPTIRKEQLRFKRRLESLARSQMKILGARQKLANVKEKNRQIMDLRLKLYKQHWTDTFPGIARKAGGPKALQMAGAGVKESFVKHKTFRYGGRTDAES